jgi:PPM family protein phosphatase
MTVRVGAATDTGPVREQNEDAVLVASPAPELLESNGLLLAVADGMGGYQRGEVASDLAIETLKEVYYDGPVGDTEIPERLKRAFRRANERIFEDGSANGDQNMMGTTLVAAVIKDSDLTIANVGDSRAYLVRADRPNQITRDHSLVAEQVAAGAMTEQEARESQHRNIITRALGHRERVDVDIFEMRLLMDDRLILSSDGLHDYVTEEDMVKISLSRRPDDAARDLVTRAIDNRSNDNVSVVVASVVPAGVVEEVEEPVPAGRSSMLVPVLVLIGLMVFIALVVVILLLPNLG